MQVLDNLFDIIAPPPASGTKSSGDAGANGLAGTTGEDGEQSLETEQFLDMLAMHLQALGTIKGEDGEGDGAEGLSQQEIMDGLSEMFAGPLPISAEIATPGNGLGYRGLIQVTPTEGEGENLGLRVSTLLNEIFQDALEQPIEQPLGFTDEDLAWLKSIDPAALAQDLDALQKLAVAVTLENGTPLTEAEFLEILEGELTPPEDALPVDVTLASDGEAAPVDENAEAVDETAEEQAVAAAASGAPTLAQETLDAETAARQRLAADDSLQDRRSARDARLAAAQGNESDGEGFAASAGPNIPANANSSAANGPINLTATAQMASLNGPGESFSQGANGQPGSGRGGDGFSGGLFGAANAEEAAQTATATQQSATQANFQSMVANTTPQRAPMSPATMQVSLQISQAAKAGQSQIRIQLSPAELGAIDVELTFDNDGKVTGKLIAEKAETLDMLRNDSRTLEKALEDAGLTLGSDGLEFSLRDGGEGDANPEFGGNGNAGDGTGSEEDGDAGEWQHVDIITEDEVDVRV